MFGVSRTTFYRWQARVEAGGLDALMPKGRRPPTMPNQTPAWVVDELLAEAVVRPTLGARRYADDLGHRGFQISASGVQKILSRHGLGRRHQRVAALAQLTAATSGLVTDDAKRGPFGFCHFAARPGDLVAFDSFYIGNLKGVGPVWQLTAVDTATRWAICHVFLGPSNTDIAKRFDAHLEKLEIVHHRTPPRSPNHNVVCEAGNEPEQGYSRPLATPTEVLARVTQRERPDWAAHSVLRRAMNHAERPDAIRARTLEVIRTLQRMPEGPERDVLDMYRDRLAALGRTIEPSPAPAIRQPARSPARSPRSRGPSIEL
jgi:transposase